MFMEHFLLVKQTAMKQALFPRALCTVKVKHEEALFTATELVWTEIKNSKPGSVAMEETV